MTNEETKKLLDEYKKDPVTFRLKYGARAESDLLETAHKKGMTKEVQKKTAKYGGKMKKKYDTGDAVRRLIEQQGDKLKSDYGKSEAAQQSERTPTTAAEAREQGWTATGIMKMSDPPLIGFEKDGKVIYVRSSNTKVGAERKKRGTNKRGGSISKYSKGGGVRAAKYKI